MFLSNGYSVLAPDSRARGESGGRIVTYGLLETAQLWPSLLIRICGVWRNTESAGSCARFLPPSPGRLPIYPLRPDFYAATFEKLIFRQGINHRGIVVSNTPIFLIHGIEDDHTPASESQELFAARPHNTQLWLVPHANHTQASSVAPIEFHNRVLAWFAQH